MTRSILRTALLLAVGLTLATIAVQQLWDAPSVARVRSERAYIATWPKVTGSLQRVYLVDKTRRPKFYGCCFYLEAAYQYEVNGAQYSGTRIGVKPDLYADNDREKVLNSFRLRYPPLMVRGETRQNSVYDTFVLEVAEQRIPVYYDPRDPQASYLDTTDYDPPTVWTIWIWPGAMAAAGIALCWIAIAFLMLDRRGGASPREPSTALAAPRGPAAIRDASETADPHVAPLLELAFEFSTTTSDARSRSEIEQRARTIANHEQWAAAVRSAARLLDHAYELCDQARSGKHPAEAVIGMLRQDCPGFSEKSYGEAYNDAMMATR